MLILVLMGITIQLKGNFFQIVSQCIRAPTILKGYLFFNCNFHLEKYICWVKLFIEENKKLWVPIIINLLSK